MGIRQEIFQDLPNNFFLCQILILVSLEYWEVVLVISYIKIPFYDAAAEKLSHGTKTNLGKVQCPEYLLKIMQNRDPRWGVAEIQKMSPPTTVGDAADMQLCVIKQGSPPVLENVAFFVTDLLTLARCAVCILNISVGME